MCQYAIKKLPAQFCMCLIVCFYTLVFGYFLHEERDVSAEAWWHIIEKVDYSGKNFWLDIGVICVYGSEI